MREALDISPHARAESMNGYVAETCSGHELKLPGAKGKVAENQERLQPPFPASSSFSQSDWRFSEAGRWRASTAAER